MNLVIPAGIKILFSLQHKVYRHLPMLAECDNISLETLRKHSTGVLEILSKPEKRFSFFLSKVLKRSVNISDYRGSLYLPA